MSEDEPAPPPRKPPRRDGPARKRPTGSPPPVRPAALDAPPPALRPAAADATIPLAPPEPEVALATPVPDGARARPPSPSQAPRSGRAPRTRAAGAPRRSTSTPPAEPSTPKVTPPPVEDTASDAPRLDRGSTPPPAASPGGLGSDDDLLDAFEDQESFHPDYDEDEVGGEAPNTERAAWWRRWLQPPDPPPPGRTGSRLSRHLSYEVIVVTVTFVVASILLFTSFDGEMRDVYVKAGEVVGAYPAETSGQVALVTIGEEALYLWEPGSGPPETTPRALIGELVSVLDAAGARIIVLDFLLDRPQDGDARLAEAAAAHGGVIAAERFVVTDPAVGGRFAPGASPTLGDGISTGFANLGEEALWTSADERLVRSARLVEVLDRARLRSAWPASVGEPQAEAEIAPHMALLAAWRMRHPDQPAEALLAALGQGCEASTGACTTSLAELGLPAGPDLHARMPVNFRGPEHADGLPTLRAAELLRLAAEPAIYRQAGVERPLQIPDWLRDAVQDKLIVVGRVDTTADDRFATPFGFPVPVRPDMDGARIQAQLIDTLLTGRHVTRTPTWLMWLVGGALVVPLVLTARHLREDVHTLAAIGVGVLLVGLGAVVFIVTDGLVLDMSPPLTVLLLGVVALRLRGWAID